VTGLTVLGVSFIPVGLLVLLTGGIARAGQFVSGIDVVEVYVTVTDSQGYAVGNLTAADFTLTEDTRRQPITVFAHGDVPLAVAVAIDRSFSMSPEQIAAATSAVRGFIAGLLPRDQLMLLAIGSEIETRAPLSTDRAAALASLAGLEPWGTTPLYDGARAAIDAIHASAGRRALVLLSDGSDRYSATTAATLIDHARRRNVLVYPIAIGRSRPAVFVELASVTGGRSAVVSDLRQLQPTLEALARELRAQYLLGYSPDRPRETESRWRSIGVRVNRPDVRVRARDGYFGP
jgi:Ca-activated chloride channel family protein